MMTWRTRVGTGGKREKKNRVGRSMTRERERERERERDYYQYVIFLIN